MVSVTHFSFCLQLCFTGVEEDRGSAATRTMCGAGACDSLARLLLQEAERGGKNEVGVGDDVVVGPARDGADLEDEVAAPDAQARPPPDRPEEELQVEVFVAVEGVERPAGPDHLQVAIEPSVHDRPVGPNDRLVLAPALGRGSVAAGLVVGVRLADVATPDVLGLARGPVHARVQFVEGADEGEPLVEAHQVHADVDAGDVAEHSQDVAIQREPGPVALVRKHERVDVRVAVIRSLHREGTKVAGDAVDLAQHPAQLGEAIGDLGPVHAEGRADGLDVPGAELVDGAPGQVHPGHGEVESDDLPTLDLAGRPLPVPESAEDRARDLARDGPSVGPNVEGLDLPPESPRAGGADSRLFEQVSDSHWLVTSSVPPRNSLLRSCS